MNEENVKEDREGEIKNISSMPQQEIAKKKGLGLLPHSTGVTPPLPAGSNSPHNLSMGISKRVSPSRPKSNLRKRIVTKLSTEDSSFSSHEMEEDENRLRDFDRLIAENNALREENNRLKQKIQNKKVVEDRGRTAWHDGIISSLTSVISPTAHVQNGSDTMGTRNRRLGFSRARYEKVVEETGCVTHDENTSKSKRSSDFPTNQIEGDENSDNDYKSSSLKRDEESNSDGFSNLEIVQSASNLSIPNILETESFRPLFIDRASWLVGLLIVQSISGFILQSNEQMLQNHLAIVNFLTMLVGAGGNAGNQASVQAIRGLALGWLNPRTTKFFLWRETKMALCLALTLGVTGFIRAALFETDIAETIAITSSLLAIVLISVALGSLLPLGMIKCSIDPAHSSTTIQVLMDILGVSITCWVSSYVLNIASK